MAESEEQYSENFQVAVRIRPPLPHEEATLRRITRIPKLDPSLLILPKWAAESNDPLYVPPEQPSTARTREKLQRFLFDHLYDEDIDQETVFMTSALPAVSAVMDGYNSTIFAYGKTGCGKTFTMQNYGPMMDPTTWGMIPRAVDHIFRSISKAPDSHRYEVYVTFIEIYNEVMYDLLTGASGGFTGDGSATADSEEEVSQKSPQPRGGTPPRRPVSTPGRSRSRSPKTPGDRKLKSRGNSPTAKRAALTPSATLTESHIATSGRKKRQFTLNELEILNDSIMTTGRFVGNDKTRAVTEHKYCVRSPDEVLRLLSLGNEKREVGAHDLNERSSRSHAIFTIELHQTIQVEGSDEEADEETAAAAGEAKGGGGSSKGKAKAKGTDTDGDSDAGSDTPIHNIYKISQLNLVDLAGSENMGQTNATGDVAASSKHINQSLTTLSRVIGMLARRKPPAHIPFRDSKLTHILKNSLGGNCKTTLLAMISPDVESRAQTLSTLNFAKLAKNIKNDARVNVVRNERELRRLELLEAQKAQAESKLRVAEEAIKEMRSYIAKLAGEKGAAVTELEKLRDSLTMALSTRQQLELELGELSEHEAQLATFASVEDDMGAQIEKLILDLNTAGASAEQVVEAVIPLIKSLRHRNVMLQETTQSQAATHKAELRDMEESIDSERLDHAELQAEHKRAKERIEALEEELKIAQANQSAPWRASSDQADGMVQALRSAVAAGDAAAANGSVPSTEVGKSDQSLTEFLRTVQAALTELGQQAEFGRDMYLLSHARLDTLLLPDAPTLETPVPASGRTSFVIGLDGVTPVSPVSGMPRNMQEAATPSRGVNVNGAEQLMSPPGVDPVATSPSRKQNSNQSDSEEEEEVEESGGVPITTQDVVVEAATATESAKPKTKLSRAAIRSQVLQNTYEEALRAWRERNEFTAPGTIVPFMTQDLRLQIRLARCMEALQRSASPRAAAGSASRSDAEHRSVAGPGSGPARFDPVQSTFEEWQLLRVLLARVRDADTPEKSAELARAAAAFEEGVFAFDLPPLTRFSSSPTLVAEWRAAAEKHSFDSESKRLAQRTTQAQKLVQFIQWWRKDYRDMLVRLGKPVPAAAAAAPGGRDDNEASKGATDGWSELEAVEKLRPFKGDNSTPPTPDTVATHCVTATQLDAVLTHAVSTAPELRDYIQSNDVATLSKSDSQCCVIS